MGNLRRLILDRLVQYRMIMPERSSTMRILRQDIGSRGRLSDNFPLFLNHEWVTGIPALMRCEGMPQVLFVEFSQSIV